jgi:hypothetical protein
MEPSLDKGGKIVVTIGAGSPKPVHIGVGAMLALHGNHPELFSPGSIFTSDKNMLGPELSADLNAATLFDFKKQKAEEAERRKRRESPDKKA